MNHVRRTRPLQSSPLLDVPPHRYGVPTNCMAVLMMPASDGFGFSIHFSNSARSAAGVHPVLPSGRRTSFHSLASPFPAPLAADGFSPFFVWVNTILTRLPIDRSDILCDATDGSLYTAL